MILKGEIIMNKRLVLKLIKDIIKQYAYVKDFKREKKHYNNYITTL